MPDMTRIIVDMSDGVSTSLSSSRDFDPSLQFSLQDDSNLYIFLELMTQGSIASLYNKYHLRDSHVSAYTRQILLGLKYLHDRNVVHRYAVKSFSIRYSCLCSDCSW